MTNSKPKIVVLDGFALNPGDLDWTALESLGDVALFDRTSPDDVVSRVGDSQIALTNKALLPREALESLPEL